MIDGRSVWVNRKCVWIARYSLKTGDLVEVPQNVVKGAMRQGGRGTADAVRQNAPRNHVRVLWQDANYLVCDKPSGIVSCDDPKSAESILREQEGVPTLEAVHRLDRDTTGCLMFAKNHAALEAAIEIFKTHKVSKTYHAIVAGRFPYAHQTINAPLDGQDARTDVSREAASVDASFLRVRIETGRTNQIRRHLASVRFPIVGDRVFGLKNVRDPRLMQVPRQMLHSSTLTMENPMSRKEQIRAHSPLPADFRAALRLFGMGK
jgi:23S rRNA pseudouridine1911/1915/1917 synthase